MTFLIINNITPFHTATGCRRITHQCNRYSPPPWRGQFPNYFGHVNDKEASVSFQKFEDIFEVASKECSSVLAQFLCGLHVPPCRDTKHPLPICRDLCLEVKSECRRAIRNVTKTKGFQWPSDLKCRHFPRKDEESCYNGPSDGGDTMVPQKGKRERRRIPGWGCTVRFLNSYLISDAPKMENGPKNDVILFHGRVLRKLDRES